MAIQYAGGTIVNTTFTNTSGTRREIVDGLVSALSSAGWTTVSGGGTGDVHMKSVATTGNGYQYVVRCYDSGSGSSARLQLKNPALTLAQTDNIYLGAQTSKVWRVIANKHQFFIFVPGSTNPRDYACGIAPSTPTSVAAVQVNAAVLIGQGKTDTDSTTTHGFLRNIMSSFSSTGGWQQNCACLTGNTIWENINSTDGNAQGSPYITNARATYVWGNTFFHGTRWADSSSFIIDPMIGWGGSSKYDEHLCRGQIWDSFIVEDQFPIDYQITYDGRTFWNLTAYNPLTRHSFFVAVT